MKHETRPSLRADLLGPVRYFIGASELPLAAPQRRSAGELLAFLLTRDELGAGRDELSSALWPDANGASATNALFKSVHSLRHLLVPDLLAGRSSAFIQWDADALLIPASIDCRIDARTIVELGDRIRAGDPVEMVELDHALSLYRGDLCEGMTPAPWLDARRDAMRGHRLDLIHGLRRRATESGQPERVIPALEALVRHEPANAAAHRLLIEALAQSGDRDGARRHADQYRISFGDHDAWEPDPELEQVLTDGLALPPAQSSAIAPSRKLQTPLPTPPNPLVGREQELGNLTQLLGYGDARLVTIVGPGGIGKTHLAMTAGAQLQPLVADGIAFVPLAPLRYAELVVPAIAASLGLPDDGDGHTLPAIAAAIGSRQFLLILDNLEHLPDSSPHIATLLASCPRLRVLATSRGRLNLRGEHRLELHPLPTPDLAMAAMSSEFEQVPSVQLLSSRLRAMRPDFQLTDASAPAVGEICRRLDGLPLALELAAAQIDHLTIGQIRDGLSDQATLLTGGPRDAPNRHQTIRACIAWSEDRLNSAERALFRRLCLFSGTFSETMASWMTPNLPTEPDTPDVRPTLASLVRSSLVVRGDPGDPADAGATYHILETIRAYGTDCLDVSGDMGAANSAVLRGVRKIAADAERSFRDSAIGTAFDRLDPLRSTIDSALAFGFGSDDLADQAHAEETAASLVHFWGERGGFRDAARWFAPLLDLPGDLPLAVWVEEQPESANRRAKALRRGAMLLYDAERFDDAIRLAGQAIRLSEALGDPYGQSAATEITAGIASARGEHHKAVELADRAVALANASGHASRQRIAESNRLLMVTDAREFDRAKELGPGVLAMAQAADDADGVAHSAITLTGVHLALGDVAAASSFLTIVEDAAELIGAPTHSGRIFMFRGWIAWQRGEIERAERSFGQAVEAHREIDDWTEYILENLHAQGLAALRLGRIDQASDLLGQAASGYLTNSDQRGQTASVIEDLVSLSSEAGERDNAIIQSWLACRLLGAADRLRQETGARRPLIDVLGFDAPAVTARPRQHLGSHRSREELVAGGSLTDAGIVTAIHDLIRLGAQNPSSRDADDRAGNAQTILTVREQEVLMQLIGGRSSAGIARDLFLSERTIHAHLRNIYRKLDVPNRAGAVRWSFEHGYVAVSPALTATVGNRN